MPGVLFKLSVWSGRETTSMSINVSKRECVGEKDGGRGEGNDERVE